MSAIGNCPDLDALAALAREATAGPWQLDGVVVHQDAGFTEWMSLADCGGGKRYGVQAIDRHMSNDERKANAAYIAAANPAAVLALIERVRELEGDAVRFAWIANHGVPIMPGAPGIYPTCGKGPAVLRRAVDAAMKPGC